MKQLYKRFTNQSVIAAAIAIFFMALSLCVTGGSKVYAAGYSDVTVEAEVKNNTVTGMADYVRVKLSTIVSGVYIYRMDTTTEKEEIIATTTSDFNYYDDKLSADNGPKKGAAYIYRIGNGTDMISIRVLQRLLL